MKFFFKFTKEILFINKDYCFIDVFKFLLAVCVEVMKSCACDFVGRVHSGTSGAYSRTPPPTRKKFYKKIGPKTPVNHFVLKETLYL